MFAVEMLPAGHGDALVVEYGTKTDPHQLLIDAGTYHAWDGVQAELMRRRRDKYEIFVVTHVDEDHIGGAISLLDDPNLNQRIDKVWFNGYVHCKSGGNVLGPRERRAAHRIASPRAGSAGTRGSRLGSPSTWAARSSYRARATCRPATCRATRRWSSCPPTVRS